MIYALIGATGWTLHQVMALTFPQLTMLLQGQGQILYPRLKPQLDAAFANLSSKPGPKGEPSDTAKLIKEHRERMSALARGEEPKVTAEQQERQEAYRIMFAEYLPPQPMARPEAKKVEPVPDLPPETARAIVAFAEAGLIPDDIWADVAIMWRQIQASATIQNGI